MAVLLTLILPSCGKPNITHLNRNTVYYLVDTFDLPLSDVSLSLEEDKEVIIREAASGTRRVCCA